MFPRECKKHDQVAVAPGKGPPFYFPAMFQARRKPCVLCPEGQARPCRAQSARVFQCAGTIFLPPLAAKLFGRAMFLFLPAVVFQIVPGIEALGASSSSLFYS